jgi:hypothetical protein
MAWLSQNMLSRWTLWLAVVLALGLLVAAILGDALGATEDTSDTIFWLVFLGGGEIIVLAGCMRSHDHRRGSESFSSPFGAIAGSLALFWSVIVPILAVVLIVLAALDARRLATDDARRGRVLRGA